MYDVMWLYDTFLSLHFLEMSSLDPKEGVKDEDSNSAEVKPKKNKCLIITVVTVVVVCVAGLAVGLGVGLTRKKSNKRPAETKPLYESIAFITPMTSELNGVIEALGPKDKTQITKENISNVEMHSFNYSGIKIVAALCGIGKVNSAYSTTVVLMTHKPQIIINVGVAGGFSGDQKILDFVFSENFTYTDVDCHGEDTELGQISGEPSHFIASQDLIKIVKDNQNEFIQKLDVSKKYPDYKRDSVNFFYGTIGSADQFIYNSNQVAHISTNFKEVICVEMEGASIAHVAHKFGTPILTIRSLSDIAVVDHDNAEDYQNSFVDASNIAGELAHLLIEKIANP